MQPWVGILLNTIGSLELLPHIKTAGSWLKPSGLAATTRHIHLQIGETAYLASRQQPDGIIQAIAVQVFLGNPGSRPSTVSTFRLEYSSRRAYLVSDVGPSRGRFSSLMAAAGGACRVPAKPWLKLPARVDPDGAVSGWVGFALVERRDLTVEEASHLPAELVAVLSDGSEIRSPFPLCEIATRPPARWSLSRLLAGQ